VPPVLDLDQSVGTRYKWPHGVSVSTGSAGGLDAAHFQPASVASWVTSDGCEQSDGGMTKRQQPASPAGKGPAVRSCPVVGIGASAGGLEACKAFLDAMPGNSGIAFVLVLHLDPKRESMMAELLGKRTAMPVVEVAHGVALKPDHVYVIPPATYITVRDGDVFHEPPVKQRGISMPIDHFFRSLAGARGERAIGIVLSGTGSDGAAGLKEIKGAGGMTMVQQPETAAYDGMPRAALMTGAVDYALPIDRMPDVLLKYVNHPYVAAADGAAQAPILDQLGVEHLRSILNILRFQAGTDFQSYKKGTLSRRIHRRMGLRHVTSAADYVELLRTDREELQNLFKDLLIGVTAFFREPEAWEVLDKEVLAPLVRGKPPNEAIRVWVAGCATGEEAYSIAMLLHEQMETQHKNLSLQIFASDLDESAIKIARTALYPESVAADVGPARLKRFFTAENGHYRVAKRVRESVVCAPQNLLSDPPFSKLDLITCRNVMMYFEADVQRRLIELFHFALRDNGCLFLGKSESLSGTAKLFAPISKEWRIFRRLETSQPPRGLFPVMPAGEALVEEGSTPTATHVRQMSRVETARRLLLERYAPAAVVVDRRYEAQFFHGALKNYFQFPDGEPTTNIVEMAVEGLRPKLRTALQKAMADAQTVTAVAQKIARNGKFVTVRIVVEPIPSYRGEVGLLLVSFTDQEAAVEGPSAEPPKPKGATPGLQRSEQEEALHQLEDELQATRSDLQLTIEELETANEELKASNEEVMSMNEELQSTNEELETSREELQSLNEELTTVNRQLEEKLGELESINNDLVNLLSSTHIATLFLGLDQKIRRFTPSCAEFLSIIDSDVGRPIGDLSLRIDDPGLKADIDRVIDKLTPVEAEVRSDRGQWFLRRITPYRTAENRIEGVVCTYTDITGLKLAARKLESRDRQQVAVVALGRTALDEIELQALFDRAATAVAEQLRCEFSEVLALMPGGRTFLRRAGSGWKTGSVGQTSSAVGIESLAGYALQTGGPVIVEDLGKEKRFGLSALNREHGVVSGVGVLVGPEDDRWGALCVLSAARREFTVDDVNFLQAIANVLSGAIARARAEEEVRLARARLSGILDNAVDAIISIDHFQKITMFNRGAEKIFGYAAKEVLGQALTMLMPARFRPAHEGHVRAFGATAVVARQMAERQEIFGRHKDGTEFAAEASISKIETPGGLVFTAILRDITERKHAEAVLESRVAKRTAELTAEIAQREATHEALVRSQKLQGLGELAGGMAHDFNNLLTVITGNLEFLEAQLEDKASRDLIQRADEAARMGARLIGRLLAFGRQGKLNPEVVNLNEIALGMTEILHRTLGEQITLNSRLASDLWSARVDPSETENAILNLAINARDAMPKGGRLVIETDNAALNERGAAAAIGLAPGDYVKLAITDTGSGMAPEVIARAFEPFFTTKGPGKGTGLGLSTLYGFAKQSGGHVTIDSTIGKGTTVTLYLPKHAGIQAGAKAKAPDKQPVGKRASETVLVVEDNPGVRDLTVRRLGILGYKVLVAENGPAAVDVLEKSERVDLVFSDVVMAGGMSGVDLARWMKAHRPATRILLTSGFADIAEDEAAAGLDVRLLRKPYKQADLARALREALEA
jgi:two-component system CheB/CheR fusion protein